MNRGRPTTWNAKRRGQSPIYQYKKLEEIYDESTPHNTICNVYGIISDFKEPAKSRGSDYYALIFIVDDTNQTQLRARLFYGDASFFPKVEIGDIVRLHRFKLHRQVDQLTLVSTKGWSWVLWSLEDRDDPFKQEKSSSESYTLLKSDKEILENLREWQRNHTASYAGKNENFKRLSEINHNEHVCLICKVIAFEQTSDSQIIAKVCDGTKPTKLFQKFEEFQYQHTSTDIPEEYIVDVAIYNNHVDKWNEISIMDGSYVLLRGLHSWPNPSNELNAKSKTCSELSLHSGTHRGRGIEIPSNYEELLNTVQNDIERVRTDETLNALMEAEPEQDTSASSQAHVSPRRRKYSSTDLHMKGTPPPSTSSQKMTNSSSVTDDVDIDTTVEDSPSALRCLQESITVITGEGMPLKLSKLKTVIKTEPSSNTSKLFRVRVRMRSCETPEEAYAGHYSPVTTLFYPTLNEGEPLCISDDVKRFEKAWREVGGLDQVRCISPERNSQLFSQWEIPLPDGQTNPVKIEKYECEKDNSNWDSMETENHIIRKRKCGDDRFTILYMLPNPEDEYGPEDLTKYAANYNRVIRLVPLVLLTSDKPPAVGIQDGVFYYACPANAVAPVVPRLQAEAEKFTKDRITSAAGSPALLPFFNFSFMVCDDSAVLKNVHLSGKNAIEFLSQTSPQDFLADKENTTRIVNDCIDALVRDSKVLECIIEKKSRLRVEDKTPVYIYSIRNTALND